MKKSILAVSVLMAMGTNAAYSNDSFNNNFTMVSAGNTLTGGTNDVRFSWDSTFNTNPATAVSNATLETATPTTFFGAIWTAYEVKLYAPGAYTLSTADTVGGAGCPFTGFTFCATGGNYTVDTSLTSPTVANRGGIVAHMKFAWSVSQGIDVVDVWQPGSWTALNSSPIWTGPGGTYSGPTYDWVSIDWDGNGQAGAIFIDGPFAGTNNANFSVNVPVPAAVWLFGSGLLGLVGIARRKKQNTA